MSDYIDRQAAINAIENMKSYHQDADDIAEMIQNMPSADVQTVRHGHWEIYVISPFDGEDVRCSECGTVGCAPYWDYCPHCGARMDGEQDE